MALTFSDFRPIGLAFEIRYPEAYLLWDRAGRIAQELQARYPVSRLTSAEPGKIVFSCSRGQEITWQLDRLIVADYRPASRLDEFYPICEQCFDITVSNLEITELKRVGFRPAFAKNFPTREEAGATLLATGILRVPEGKQFNVEARCTLPEYGIRREGEKFGYALKISVQTVKYEFAPPPQWQGNEVEAKEEQRVTLDLDWYTVAPMPVGAMRVTEWLTQIMHAVRRDTDGFFGR